LQGIAKEIGCEHPKGIALSGEPCCHEEKVVWFKEIKVKSQCYSVLSFGSHVEHPIHVKGETGEVTRGVLSSVHPIL